MNKTLVGSATGADVMGDPLETLAWLANTVTGYDERLVAGQVILTGSVVPKIWVNAPAASA